MGRWHTGIVGLRWQEHPRMVCYPTPKAEGDTTHYRAFLSAYRAFLSARDKNHVTCVIYITCIKTKTILVYEHICFINKCNLLTHDHILQIRIFFFFKFDRWFSIIMMILWRTVLFINCIILAYFPVKYICFREEIYNCFRCYLAIFRAEI